MHSIINGMYFLYYVILYVCVYICVHIYVYIYERDIYLFLYSCGTHRACIEAIIHKRHINILQINTKKKRHCHLTFIGARDQRKYFVNKVHF